MKQHFTSAMSQAFGRFASKQHPLSVQKVINRSYVRMMGLDMREFDAPESYPTLNALFTRRFKTMRSFSAAPEAVISPCDSLITESGIIQGGLALQIKGMSYSVDALLGKEIDEGSKKALEEGAFLNFYLSPRDYHRYHAPMDMEVTKALHLPGKLYPVNIPSLKKRIDLFIENERVVLECLSGQGKRFFLVLVGALNVGKMEVGFEPRISTNTVLTPSCYTYEGLRLTKGDDFGCFQMGSTIVMLCEKGMMEAAVQSGQTVRFGETIGKLV